MHDELPIRSAERPTQLLSEFLARTTLDDIPADVTERTKHLVLDGPQSRRKPEESDSRYGELP